MENPHPDYFKESNKKVKDFIRKPEESVIKKFFLEDIEELLQKYEPGDPKMKPDVLKQTIEIEEKRKKMMMEQQQKMQEQMPPMPGIMVQEPGKPPRMMSPDETLKLIQSQQQDIQMLTTRNKELEEIIVEMQQNIMRLTNGSQKNENCGGDGGGKIVDQLAKSKLEKLKSEPDITISI